MAIVNRSDANVGLDKCVRKLSWTERGIWAILEILRSTESKARPSADNIHTNLEAAWDTKDVFALFSHSKLLILVQSAGLRL